eukprot:m.183407 g.183407  ORF g.183407 m.183407 type:complete len:179 (-) comp18478_c0_seq3:169-705(-)
MDVEEENSVGTALQGLPSLRQGNFSAEAMITKNRKLKPKRYIHTSADAAIEAPQLIKNESESILMRFFYQTITAKQPISAPTITTEHPISAPSSANISSKSGKRTGNAHGMGAAWEASTSRAPKYPRQHESHRNAMLVPPASLREQTHVAGGRSAHRRELAIGVGQGADVECMPVDEV